jgi:hypothetical protein
MADSRCLYFKTILLLIVYTASESLVFILEFVNTKITLATYRSLAHVLVLHFVGFSCMLIAFPLSFIALAADMTLAERSVMSLSTALEDTKSKLQDAFKMQRGEKEKFEAQIISLHQDIEFARAEALTQSLSARVRFSGRNTRTSFS